MKKSIFIFALLLVAFSNSLWSADVDTVWVSDFVSEIRFQHPVTKNLVLEEFNNLKVLDSKNGELIREIPFKTDWENKPYISPDGTKLLHTNIDDTYIYEYPSMQLVYKLDTCLYTKLINDNEIVYRKAGTLNLIKYNIITKESKIHTPDGSVKNIVTSPDGRFIAYSTNFINDKNKPSQLLLIDAKTFNLVQTIDQVSFNEHDFGRFNFSNDGKYIVFDGKVINGRQHLKIVSTETMKIVKEFKPDDNSIIGYINFISDNLYTMQFDDVTNQNSKTFLFDINTDKILFVINNGVASPIFNDELKHFYYREGFDGKIYCLNISNLITGVTPTQPTEIVKYQNKELTINKENVRQIEISDISGRVILNKIIDNPISNNTILPLNLVNGSYLINVITDKESFTHKLMVLE